LCRAGLGVAVAEKLRLLGLLWKIDFGHTLIGRSGRRIACGLHLSNLFLLRGHDALQRRVTNLADARLNRQ
jgi:hypothetical protein